MWVCVCESWWGILTFIIFFPIHLGVMCLMCGCGPLSSPRLRSVSRGSVEKICNVFIMRQLKNERLSQDGHDF